MAKPADSRRPRAHKWGALIAAAGGLAVMLLWAGALSSPETLLARSYETALGTAETDMSGARLLPASLPGGSERSPVEAIWLSKPGLQSPGLRRPLTVGDRITISSQHGKLEKLMVVRLEQIDGAVIGAPGVRFQLVTSKIEGAADDQIVRLLIAVHPEQPVQPSSGDKTL